MICLSKQRAIFKIMYRNFSKKKCKYERQVFSAIQPSGDIHLGNYLGAIRKMVLLQNEGENVIFSIADLHALTLPKDQNILQRKILTMAAAILASGIDPNKTIFFQQSDVPQHTELCWILGTCATMARLAQLPQYKEKTETMKNIPLGIFIYPILQSADIALYKTTHVPVGKDQIHHILLSNHLIHFFNNRFGETFPLTEPLIDEQGGSIKSLLNPSKKMSKSDVPRSKISLTDPPDEIRKKCKIAVTDFTSAVTYDTENRPGVSNLIKIHSLLTNKSTETICKESENLITSEYKLLLADVIIETLKPIREEIDRYLASPDYLHKILSSGAEKAAEKAVNTMREVKEKIGIKEYKNIQLNQKAVEQMNVK